MAAEMVAGTFEGSVKQARILRLREVEGRLYKLRTLAQLLWKTAEADDDEVTSSTAQMMTELANEAQEHLGLVER